MAFARKVWQLLVGIKDALSLVFLLLFFFALYAVLTARPNAGTVRDGALLLRLDGQVVEEKAAIDPLALILSEGAPTAEYQARDIVHALEEAAEDARITAVVFDLTTFLGGGQVHLAEIGAAIDKVRAAGKPVLTYAVAYTNPAMQIAAHASEVWADPLGGAIVAGPGGSNLYYKGLIDRLGIDVHVYRVGTYKSAVEPYTSTEMSPAARENYAALYGALWDDYLADVRRARPAANYDLVTQQPVRWLAAAGGDQSRAAVQAGLIDKLGTEAEFGDRVAALAGKDEWDETPGAYASSDLDAYLADRPYADAGRAIGVVTIAGTITDGDAGPGTAGGDRIADLLDEALAQDLAGLVVRIDSPGGSVLASEEIRRAILRHKATGIPIAVSMANLAASGGYWVSTPAARVFADPATITGSIGVFAVIPSFQASLDKIGVNASGVTTTPLSGQPDIIGGFNPEIDAILQMGVETVYRRFTGIVAQARRMPVGRVDRIAQGRVWDGGTARQLGLVDQFGGMDEALAWVAGQAELGNDWHAQYLGEAVDGYGSLIERMMGGGARTNAHAPQDFAGLAAQRQADLVTRAASEANRLTGVHGTQVYCLECAPWTPLPRERTRDAGLWARLLAALAE